jgi:hypothetical protein
MISTLLLGIFSRLHRPFFAILCVLFLGNFCSVARADEEIKKPNFWAVGLTGGTQGIGGEASYLLSDRLVLRSNVTYLGLNVDENIDSNAYKFDFGALFAGGTLDFHPFQSGWRISGGVKYVDLQFDAGFTGGMEIGDNDYTVDEIGTVTVKARNSNQVAPYVGFGYDASHFSGDGYGLRFGIDVGALYVGDPDIAIATTKTVSGLETDIAKETAALEDKIGQYFNFYPVAMVSGRMTF